MKNAISIDLEDWFCVHNLRHAIRREDWPNCELRVMQSAGRILDILDRHRTKATFFVLGWIAERLPELIEEVDRRGHEIATHGYSHRLLTDMNPVEFDVDLGKALEITSRHTGQDIVGFRAPSFSVTEKTLWSLEVLTKNGIRYDSSIYPIGLHPDYGIPTAPLAIHRPNGPLLEFPLSCVELFGMRIPCSGGGYFRLFPYPLTKMLLRACNRQGRPVVFYLHPWEVDPGQPRVAGLSRFQRFRHYHNLGKTLGRLDALLSDFRFTTIREILEL
jgi:polysaccharide deacetylase family protein (PEP-CTERM system associated)